MPKEESTIQEVMVKLKTNIKTGTDEETFELTTFGTVHQKGSSVYVRFIEHVEESGEVKTTFKYNGEELLIIRNGALKMRQLFRKGKDTEGNYDSMFGSLQMMTRTNELTHSRNQEENIETFLVKYDLILQEQNVGTYTLTLTVPIFR